MHYFTQEYNFAGLLFRAYPVTPVMAEYALWVLSVTHSLR